MVFGLVLLRRIVFERRLMITFAKITGAVCLMAFAVYDAKLFGLGLWILVAAGAATYGTLVFFLRVVSLADAATIWRSISTRSRPAGDE
jgi:hypothetical protein